MNEFNDRVADINAYYTILAFEDAVETYKLKPLVNTDQNQRLFIDNTMQKCMRANAIIMLYNLVESTFNNCIQGIYDAIRDDHLKYADVNDFLRKVWIGIKYKPDNSLEHIREKSKQILDSEIFKELEYDDLPSGISGNLDFPNMVEISKKFNINFGNVPDVENVKATLYYLKKNRNDLAHGNVTFSSVGASVSYQELDDYRKYTISFLNHCISVYDNYVHNKEYKKVE
jgi:hypothetical protein